MAVDFSLLPVEAPLPDNAPSRLVWTIVFFVLFVACMFAVLMLWPANIPTRTPQFWAALAVLPLCVSSLVVLRRISAFEARKLDVMEQNDVNRRFNARVFDAASVPLAIVGLAYRVSADENVKTFEALLKNTLKLESQQPVALGGEPVKARWLSVPGVVLKPGAAITDRDRQHKAVAWLFAELLIELTDVVQALPAQVSLSVQFAISSALTVEERDVLWTSAWKKHFARSMRIDTVERPVNLDSLDVWLDQLIEAPDQQARLIVAIQLHPLLSRTPPQGSAETAVALLLMPDSPAKQLGVKHRAKLHRPVRSKLTDAHDAMMPALKWAHADGAEMAGCWQTGFNDTTAAHLIKPAMALGLTIKPNNLDESVGYAGVAAPWLALTCAAAWLSESRPQQIILSGTAEHVDCAVLRQPVAESAAVSSQGSE